MPDYFDRLEEFPNCLRSCTLSFCRLCVPPTSPEAAPTQCQICLPGYRLNPSRICEPCQMANCNSCQNDITRCDLWNGIAQGFRSCIETHYWGEGSCAACSRGCRECNHEGVCLRCDTARGFYMWRDMTCKLSHQLKVVIQTAIFLITLMSAT